MNRKAFIEGINNNYKYDFGEDYNLITEIMKLPEFEGISTITYSVKMDGKRLKQFIKEKAPYHIEIIKDIDDNKMYELNAWDY